MKTMSLPLKIMTRLLLLALLLSAAGVKNVMNAQAKRWHQDNAETGRLETISSIFTTTARDSIGEVQNLPSVSLPLHDLLEDQDAYFTNSIIQTTTLAEGWNWWSPNVEITLEDLQAALIASLGTNASITIKSQTQNCKLTRGVWTGQLTMLDLARMYNISVNADFEITLEGMPVNPAEHPVTINSGANWFGFPFSESMTITEAFGAFGINGDVIKSQLLNCRNTRGVWTGQLDTLEPGKGYIYNSAAADTRTFTFPIRTR